MEDEQKYGETPVVSTMEETDEKCASCGGTLSYDPAEKLLVCGYCGAKQAFEETGPEIALEIDLESVHEYANHDWGAAVKSVICKSCGAESIYDALQIADVCPYCGSNLVVEAGAADALAPGGVCGFAVSVKEAAAKFKKWLKRRIFAPGKVKKGGEPEAFKGVYLPYWTFDTETVTDYTARYGKDRTVVVKGVSHTHTDWYRTKGVFRKEFDDLLIPGTDRYDKASMEKIEPFDTAGSLVYKPEYLAGYTAERYSLGLNDAWKRGREKARGVLTENIKTHIKRTHHADRVSSLKISVDYRDVKFKYLLLPVWLSSYRYKEKVYHFMVNGQTGRVGGKAPVSPLRVLFAVLLGAALCAAFIWLITVLTQKDPHFISFSF